MEYNNYAIPLQEIDKNGNLVNRKQADIDKDTLEAAWALLRSQRLAKLKETDFAFLSDATGISDAKLNKIKTYRQALRDLPDNTPDPTNVVWPKSPI